MSDPLAQVMAGVNPNPPTLTVGVDNTYATPEELALQRQRAKAILAQGGDTSPLKGGIWEGISRVGHGLIGGLEQRRAAEMAQRNQKIDADALAAAMAGDSPNYKALLSSPALRGAALSMMAQDAQAKRQEAMAQARYAQQDAMQERQQTFAERQAEMQRQFQQAQLAETTAARKGMQAEAAAARQEAMRLQAEIAKGNRVTYRPLSPEEQKQFPGAAQIGSDGKLVYAPTEAIKQMFVAPGAPPENRAAQADALGVPAKLDVDPYAPLSPDARKKRAEREQAEYVKESAKDREQRAILEAQRADFARFREAEARANLGAVGRMAARLPGAALLDSDIATMQSVTAKVAPTIRQPGSGASSDYDAKQFEKAVVGVDKPKETNAQIMAAYDAASENAMGFMDFKAAFMDTHGTISGADRAWKRYLDANPIFDKAAGGLALNPNRVGWQDYFRQENAKGKAPATGATGGWDVKNRPQGATDLLGLFE